MNTITQSTIQFDLPEYLACPSPTEGRGLRRDEVRLLVTNGAWQTGHATFNDLGAYLNAGDVLAVNTSATVASALPVLLHSGGKGMVHFSNKLNDKKWLIEMRKIVGNKTVRWKGGKEGMVFQLPSGASLKLNQRFYRDLRLLDLWKAELITNQEPEIYMAEHAQLIKYEKLNEHYPLSYYQTFFSFHPGSAEMPSAGRGFTSALVERLLKKGVVFAPVLLHTGISSLEEDETPYPEYMEVNPLAASIINTAKNQGRRIIAVGTTVLRAIESAADSEGTLMPFRGDTELFIDNDYSVKVVDGLLTGFHEPRASHLHMLQALAGTEHIERAYHAAIKGEYYWHQFGDLHLILP